MSNQKLQLTVANLLALIGARHTDTLLDAYAGLCLPSFSSETKGQLERALDADTPTNNFRQKERHMGNQESEIPVANLLALIGVRQTDRLLACYAGLCLPSLTSKTKGQLERALDAQTPTEPSPDQAAAAVVGGAIFPDTFELCALLTRPSAALAARLAQRALAHPADYQSLPARLRCEVDALLQQQGWCLPAAPHPAAHTAPAPLAPATAGFAGPAPTGLRPADIQALADALQLLASSLAYVSPQGMSGDPL